MLNRVVMKVVSERSLFVSVCNVATSRSTQLKNCRMMIRMAKVLLIDDDKKHSELLKSYLKQFGIALECAGDADEGMRKLSRTDPDLLLLDIMLPGRDGFDICREVRKKSAIPIIMLTARGDVVDRVSGLEIGADDYVGKPFEPRELVARIQTILRRASTTDSRDPLLRFEGIEIDTGSKEVRVDGSRIELTTMETELLILLARRSGKKVSRDEILNELRGIDAAILTRSVDIMVSRLRQKIGDSVKPPRFIQTVWGTGYAFAARPIEDD